MFASHTSTASAGFVTEAPVKPDDAIRRRVAGLHALPDRSEQTDINENGSRRRARLQGLALMIASSLVSVAVVYGIWTVLSVVI
jgi:hypothetical protein